MTSIHLLIIAYILCYFYDYNNTNKYSIFIQFFGFKLKVKILFIDKCKMKKKKKKFDRQEFNQVSYSVIRSFKNQLK